MKKLLAIAVSALLLTAALPVQGFAKDMTEYAESIDANTFTVQNVQYKIVNGKALAVALVDSTAETVYFPASVNSYPVDVCRGTESERFLHDCYKLREITVDPENAALKSEDGVLFDKTGSYLIAYPPAKEGDYVIPDSVITVQPMAFYKTKALGTLTIPDTVEEFFHALEDSSIIEIIGSVPVAAGKAAINCPNLKSITFRQCKNQNEVAAGVNLTGLASLESVSFTPEFVSMSGYHIADCPKLKALELPQSDPMSQNSSLEVLNCAALERLCIYNSSLSKKPDSGLAARSVRIKGCPSLREITVEQIPYVYSDIPLELEELPALERVIFNELPKSAVAGTSSDDDPVYDPLTVGEGCASFAVEGREENANLQSWCKNHQITFSVIGKSGDVSADEIIEGKGKTILRAGNLEYELHTSTNPQDIESVTLIGVIDRTVESIELPASVNSYPVRYVHTDNDPDFFWHCENLKEIRVDPENADLKSIDGVLFNKSGSILYAYPRMKEGDYVIPDGTRYVWHSAFYQAQKLGVVTVPESVVNISGVAFAESSVTDFVGALPIVHGTVVKNCKNLRSLSIRTPQGGRMANAWFTGLSSLESLKFSPDVIVEENLGLIDCPLLKYVEFPQTVPSDINSSIEIANCDSMESVTLYNSVLSGKHQESFIRNCPKLREITVEQIPYVYSNMPLELEELPALERVIFNELPKSAVAGTSSDDDPVYDPLTVGEGCASFAVAGQSANINLQKWCASNQVTFKTIDTQRGDVNLDGDLNIMDVIAVNKFILGIRKLDDAAMTQADVNHDASVTSEDALEILKAVLDIAE